MNLSRKDFINKMKKNLNGKKILLIGIGFYDYEKKIVEKLKSRGAYVDYYLEKPINKLMNKLCNKFKTVIDYYQRYLISKLDNDYNYILVIKGEALTEHFLSKLKKMNKKAELIMYQWDSIKRIPEVKKTMKYFDSIFTFDRIDSLNYDNMKFRPLFYRDETKKALNKVTDKKIDLLFIGWMHSNRYEILKKIKKEKNKELDEIKFYLHTGIINYLKNKIQNKKFNNFKQVEFIFRKMDYEKVISLSSKSKVILDITHPEQNGLTIRTIEALGSGNKLITNNKDITNYDFFKKENILLFDSDKLEIDSNFWQYDYVDLSSTIYERYSLDSWIDDVFLWKKFNECPRRS